MLSISPRVRKLWQTFMPQLWGPMSHRERVQCLLAYANRILRVDLTNEKCESQPLKEEWVGDYIGGKGLAARYLYDLLPKGVDPLSPRNVLVFMTGPLTGTIASTMSRVVLATKSPLTNTFLDSYAGGYFPAELKFAGFDGIIVSGKAPKDVYLWIKDGQAELRDATHLKGMDTHESTAQILKETEKGAHAGVIGPAGENLVKYAGVAFDVYHFAGRRRSWRSNGIEDAQRNCSPRN